MTDEKEIVALVVDDDVGIRLMLTRVLTREQFTVDSAKDGAEAIEKLKHREYDVVFLDLMMPRVDGFGVMRYLTQSSPQSLKTVIVLTAFSPQALDQMETGSRPQVLQKPFDIHELVAKARELVADKRAGEAPEPPPFAGDAP